MIPLFDVMAKAQCFPVPRVVEKMGGGENNQGRIPFLINIEAEEKTGSRWRSAASMPLNGRSDAVHYGGGKKWFSQEDFMEN